MIIQIKQLLFKKASTIKFCAKNHNSDKGDDIAANNANKNDDL